MPVLQRVLRYLKKKRRQIALYRDPLRRRFLRTNRAFWKEHGAFEQQGERVLIVEGAYGTDYRSLGLSISAAIVAGAYKAQVIYLLDDPVPMFSTKGTFQRSFSHCSFKSVPALTRDRRDEILAEAHAIFDGLQLPEDVLGIIYRGVPIGEQIYDGVLKRKHSSLWRLDARVLEKIQHAVATVEAVETLCQRYEVCGGLYGHVSCDGAGVAARTLLHHRVPVFLGRGGLTALKRYNRMQDTQGRLSPHIHVPKHWFWSLSKSCKAELVQQAEVYLAERMSGKYVNKIGLEIYAPENTYYESPDAFAKAYGLDPSKPCVFIMLHVMNDDPHCEKQYIFRDYYDWFIRTLDVVKDVPEVNWIFKQHPVYRRGYDSDDADVRGDIEAVDRPNIAYLDENESFHSASLPNVAHALVTCGGTAGLEYTTQGIPAIMGSESFYGSYGVCHAPTTFEDYAALMRDIRHLPPPTPERVRRAKLLFYLSNGRLVSGFRFREGILPDVTDFDVKQYGPVERLEGITSVLEGPRRAAVSEAVRALQQFVRETEKSTKEEDLYLKL